MPGNQPIEEVSDGSEMLLAGSDAQILAARTIEVSTDVGGRDQDQLQSPLFAPT